MSFNCTCVLKNDIDTNSTSFHRSNSTTIKLRKYEITHKRRIHFCNLNIFDGVYSVLCPLARGNLKSWYRLVVSVYTVKSHRYLVLIMSVMHFVHIFFTGNLTVSATGYVSTFEKSPPTEVSPCSIPTGYHNIPAASPTVVLHDGHRFAGQRLVVLHLNLTVKAVHVHQDHHSFRVALVHGRPRVDGLARRSSRSRFSPGLPRRRRRRRRSTLGRRVSTDTIFEFTGGTLLCSYRAVLPCKN